MATEYGMGRGDRRDAATAAADSTVSIPWDEFALAYVHPIQLKLFRLIKERGEASPVELSRHAGLTLAKVSHHIRSLRRHGMIELTYTTPVRGAIKHGYRVAQRNE